MVPILEVIGLTYFSLSRIFYKTAYNKVVRLFYLLKNNQYMSIYMTKVLD